MLPCIAQKKHSRTKSGTKTAGAGSASNPTGPASSAASICDMFSCIFCCGRKKEVVNVQNNQGIAIANPVGDSVTSNTEYTTGTELAIVKKTTTLGDPTAPDNEIPSLGYLQQAKG